MWDKRGIRPDSTFVSLLYNAAAQSLIAFCRRQISQARWVGDLYSRDKSAGDYRLIQPLDDARSFEHPVSAHRASLIYFNVLRFRGQEGADWEAVYSFDLSTGKAMPILTSASLQLDGKAMRGWIASLIGVTPDDDGLVCSVGMEMAVGKDSTRASYSVRTFDLKTFKATVLFDLPDTFL